MQIVINQYPKGFPQDLKFAIMSMGFEYVGSEQLKDIEVILNFIEKED